MPMKYSAFSLGALLLIVSACGGSDGNSTRAENSDDARPGETAVWNVDAEQPPGSPDKAFSALVERLGCADGQTGGVLAPAVVERDDAVVVTFAVEALAPGAHLCPGNKPVPYTVTLSNALGGRHLIDGSCLAGEAATTSACLDGGQRWPTQGR